MTLEEFLITGASLDSLERQIDALAEEIKALQTESTRLASRVDKLLDRLEVSDARKQNKLIRTHAPVPAFKQQTAAAELSSSPPSSMFSFIPARLRGTPMPPA